MSTLAATLIAAALITQPAPQPEPPAPTPCTVTSSVVFDTMATFTVGPAGCVTPTAPISFSAYNMPGGYVQPFAEQVATDHATPTGVAYTDGAYILTLTGLMPCNWQTDLYWSPDGLNQEGAPHSHPINGMNVGWDYSEGNVCELPTVDPPVVEPPTVAPPVDTPVTLTAQPAPELAMTGTNTGAMIVLGLIGGVFGIVGILVSVLSLMLNRRRIAEEAVIEARLAGIRNGSINPFNN